MNTQTIKQSATAAIFVMSTGFLSTVDADILAVPTNSAFEVDIVCEDGISHIDLVEANSSSYLNIGSIRNEGVVEKPIMKLLNSETRSWIGKEIMIREGFLYDEASRTEPQYEIASCLGLRPPESTAEGTSVCYPDENTDCSLFEWVCTATGGQLGHNICTW